jgi:hypothetical protein
MRSDLDECRRALSEERAYQSATSEILRVISTAPTDPQPVFDLIAESAVKLCGAEVGNVSVVDGEWVRLVAVFGLSTVASDALRRVFPMQLSDPGGGAARAIRECAAIQIPDVRGEPGYKIQESASIAGFPCNSCCADAPGRLRHLEATRTLGRQLLVLNARACIQLRRIVTAANCVPARKFLASLS